MQFNNQVQGFPLTRAPGFWRLKITEYPSLTLEKITSCVTFDPGECTDLRQRDQKLLRVIDNWLGAEYLLVDANLYRPFEAQVRPVGGVLPIEKSNNDQLKHCWFDDACINVPLFIWAFVISCLQKRHVFNPPKQNGLTRVSFNNIQYIIITSLSTIFWEILPQYVRMYFQCWIQCTQPCFIPCLLRSKTRESYAGICTVYKVNLHALHQSC